MTETALYRHFDGDSRLLYVGISLSPTYRLSQHRLEAPWFRAIRNVTIEYLPTRDAALFAEKMAIRRERPIHNVVHNIGHQEMVAPEPILVAPPKPEPGERGSGLLPLYYFLLRVTEEFLENPSEPDVFSDFYDGAVEEALETRTEFTCGAGRDWRKWRADDLATAASRPEISRFIPELTEFRFISQGYRPWPPRGYAANRALQAVFQPSAASSASYSP